ncbi:MAG: hypothetical protein AVDCRST_MAG56-4984 [uncultured Cytophagales bacterium]|uniref:Uncharacterized protein n=1 Tax=uncultured Cytophagales bacterium TaxID=158755 RepID=A0A6J4K3U8_9SPHI|nr:MAG: hypothetical protein AVDCRST_MAG56-4984 [uncultured Cytophagales bacterium]
MGKYGDISGSLYCGRDAMYGVFGKIYHGDTEGLV